MRFDKFTLKVQEGLQEAQTLANNLGHQGIEAEHLFLALLRQPEGIIDAILKKLGVDSKNIESALVKVLDSLPRVEGTGMAQGYITPRLNKLLDKALTEAAQLKDEYVSAEHVLIAIAEEKEGQAGKILRQAGITRDNIFNVLKDIRGNQRVTDPNPEGKYQALQRTGKKRGF